MPSAVEAPGMLMGFRCYEALLWECTCANIQYTGNPGSPLCEYSSTGSTVVLAVQYHWQYNSTVSIYWTKAQPYKKIQVHTNSIIRVRLVY